MYHLICAGLLALSLGLAGQSPQQSRFLRITPDASGPPGEPKEGVVDQSFMEPVGLAANIHEAHDLIAQTYTAGITGRLTGINIDVHSKRALNPEQGFVMYPLRVALYEVEKVENRYPGSVIAEVTLTDDQAPLSMLITFPTVVPQVRGVRYAIVVSYPNGQAAAGSRWLGNWSGGRGNIGGEMVSGDDGKNWRASRTNDYTLRFRTYVVADPVIPVGQRSGTAKAATKFSSAYTDLTKCSSGMTKKEEKQAEEYGSDIPTRCKGLGGYDIYISYSACASYISLERGEERIPLATQAVDWKQQMVEWRLAQGKGEAKPFAVIMRVYEYSGDEQCVTGGKITSESLFVQGLKGYEHISEAVDVKETPNPNLKARQIADKGYAQPKS